MSRAFKPGVPSSRTNRTARIAYNRAYMRQRARDARRYRASAVYKSSQESKWVETLVEENVPNTTGTNDQIIPLNLIQLGSGAFNRIGRKVTLKSLRLQGFAVNLSDAGGPSTPNLMRMVVVYDKQPSGTLPNFNDIFEGVDQQGNTVSTIFSSLNYSNMSRFQVIRDTVIDFNAGPNTSATTAVRVLKSIDDYIKVNRETVYSGTANPVSITNISSGALYLVLRSVNNAADAHSTVGIQCRLKYHDN